MEANKSSLNWIGSVACGYPKVHSNEETPANPSCLSWKRSVRSKKHYQYKGHGYSTGLESTPKHTTATEDKREWTSISRATKEEADTKVILQTLQIFESWKTQWLSKTRGLIQIYALSCCPLFQRGIPTESYLWLWYWHQSETRMVRIVFNRDPTNKKALIGMHVFRGNDMFRSFLDREKAPVGRRRWSIYLIFSNSSLTL